MLWKGLNFVLLEMSVFWIEEYNVMGNSEEVTGTTEYMTL